MTDSSSIRSKFVEAFSAFRAENMSDDVFSQFTAPAYFPELLNEQPCFLIGGRGTGKTTTLRCLSYEGRQRLRPDDAGRSDRFIGLYHRLNTSRLANFTGPERTDSEWERIFSHYFNLILCSLVLDFLATQHGYVQQRFLQPAIEAMSLAFGEASSTVEDGRKLLKSLTRQLELDVNNVGQQPNARLSMLGSPVDALLDELHHLDLFRGKVFMFLVDEYENLLDTQQRVVNTVIKHCGSRYTFKVGVRDQGFRVRTTLNEHEQLIDPADFRRIEIVDRLTDSFPKFAALVCNKRLQKIRSAGMDDVLNSIEEYFPTLTLEAEAIELGVESRVREALTSLPGQVRREIEASLASCSELEKFAVLALSQNSEDEITHNSKEAAARSPEWKNRYGNYKFALMYAIKKGRSGRRRIYAGWDTITTLASGNIRYLLEIVHNALMSACENEDGNSVGAVPPALQSKAVVAIGQKNLRELEGLSKHGGRLARLVLSLGRVFQILAEDPVGHAPEVSQFEVPDKETDTDEVRRVADEILREAVMHMALVRFPGTKLQESSDIRDYDFALHPLFAAFFWFSFRRKRKLTVSRGELAGLVEKPVEFIDVILKRHNRDLSASVLPEQLALFENFFRS